MPRGIWKRPSDAEKLLKHCVRDAATGCLNCMTSSWRGYPKAMVGGNQIRANRAAWILAKGTIPSGLHVLHRCDNRKCVEIEHLFLGTHQDNMDDKIAKGRQLRGEQVGISKLTAEQARDIFLDHRPASEICLDYLVSSSAVRLIKQGKNWCHVTARLT